MTICLYRLLQQDRTATMCPTRGIHSSKSNCPNILCLSSLQTQPIRSIIAAVQEWNQNDTYNLYLSDTLAMENVKTTQMLDLYEDESVYHRHWQV
ncbi:uncharacterized protein [Salvelinus alpinus]|uniref:uncharacterized protein isoform X2 n=1 Tax=Salvelinus alpinus TaxID=8036 RepID=UPI0039FBEEBA